MSPENKKGCYENIKQPTEIVDNNGNILVSKKRKFMGCSIRGNIKREFQIEKEPLPMKFRALPRSFWQQPNEPNRQSPAEIICPELPIGKEEISDNCQPISKPPQMYPPEITTPANTELLFSLFRVVDKRHTILIHRGRPKKPVSAQVGLKDADPCLVSTVNEPPLAVVNKSRKNAHNEGYSNLLAELVVRL